jgi:hypothetical protein
VDPDPGGPKTCGSGGSESGGSESGSATLLPGLGARRGEAHLQLQVALQQVELHRLDDEVLATAVFPVLCDFSAWIGIVQ